MSAAGASLAKAEPERVVAGDYRRVLDDRERFLAFAFAGADLLLEVDPDSRIVFAAGAFRSRFGWEPADMIGQLAGMVVAPEDSPAFTTCLALLTVRGRLPPTVLRVSDANRTPLVLSGLARPAPGGAARLCLSLGLPCGSPPAVAQTLCTSAVFSREAEGRVRAARATAQGVPPALDLLEIIGSELPPEQVNAALLDQAGAGTTIGELSPGRFGLLRAPLSAATPDLSEVVAELQASFDRRGLTARVASAERLELSGPADAALPSLQAVRALRCALSAFSRGGAQALAAAGFENGLAGFVDAVSERTAALRRGIAERRFRLAFQPIVHLEDGSVHHYEALLRPEPMQGVPSASPSDLVSLAEMVGVAEELDWTVFEMARAAASQAGVAVAFNVSGLSVQNPAFRARLLAALERPTAGAAPRLLAEITETAEIEDEAAAARMIEGLRERGVPVCLDDFGAGAAAFRYLRDFRVDHVKIDGTYVRHAAESERDRGFVGAMIDLSLTVGAETIAEQIETPAVAAVMRSLGVRYGQGWLFGRAAELPSAPQSTVRRRGPQKDRWE